MVLIPADATFEACLQHLYGAVRACGRPVSLVGHSGGGGSLVTAFAERWPEHVSRMVYVVGMMLAGWNELFADLVDIDHPATPRSFRHRAVSGMV